ncbi:hypothetical protein D9615_008796 [Tricholomella constricta]|uniref:Uncharacterized protein n=1 Tax=Tricholomella constricta TaxID=117010 RepID=A0A8H5H7S3_9AGAR|nr:hypothetical protein D9615_008796 [Tricholomella constricta]
MSLPNIACPNLFLNSRSSSPDDYPDTSSPLFPTLRTYFKSPSREIELVRKDQAALLSQVVYQERDVLVKEDTLRSINEIEKQSKPLEDRIKATKFYARIQPNTRLGLHSEIEDCRNNLEDQVQIYQRKSNEAAKARKEEADRLEQRQLQGLFSTASGNTAPRQMQQGAQPLPNRANIPSASKVPISRDLRTNICSAPNAQREAESRTLSSPSTEITTVTEDERNENRPPSYRPMPSTSERGHGLSTASPQDLSPTHILLPHEVQHCPTTQPTRSAGPSSGYNRPLPNPPAVPSTGTSILQGVDDLAVTPGQTRTHSTTVSQSPPADTRTTRPAGSRAPTQNHPSHFAESARAQSQQATRPTDGNHFSTQTIPSQSTDRGSSPGHGREFRKTDDDSIAHSFSHDATASDDRAFHLNPNALSVKASDGHDRPSTSTSSHVSQRHSSAPSASQLESSHTPNSSATPIVSPRQRSASQALEPSLTQSSTGSQDRRLHDKLKAVGQSPRDPKSGQISQGPTVPLRQPPLEGLTPTVQVDQRSPPNSSATPIASPRQRSASQAPQPSSTQSYIRSRDRRAHNEAVGQSPGDLKSGQISQGPLKQPQPPVGGITPTLQVEQRNPSNSSATPIASPRQRSASQAAKPSSTQYVFNVAISETLPHNFQGHIRAHETAAYTSGAAPQNERPRRPPHTTSGTGQSNDRREAQIQTSTSRAENSTSSTGRRWSLPLKAAFVDEGLRALNALPCLRLEEHQMLLSQIQLHKMTPHAGPLTQSLVPVKVTAAERLRSRHRLAELRIVHSALDVTPVDGRPEPLNRETLQCTWSLPPKAAFIDETPPCQRFLQL